MPAPAFHGEVSRNKRAICCKTRTKFRQEIKSTRENCRTLGRQQAQSYLIAARMGFSPVTERVSRSRSNKGSKMSQLRTLVRSAKIRGRICPQCQALMMLSDITPVRPNFEQHTFECVDCGQVAVTMVEGRNNAAVAA